MARLDKLAAEERDAVARLLLFLQRHHAMPAYLGSFPLSFTTVNFVTLEYLRPLLAQHARQEVAHLEEDLRQAIDPAARELRKDLLALKKRHLSELESFKPLADVHEFSTA